MDEIILTLKRAPHRLFRVGIGEGEAVYLPVRPGNLHANGEPVWCDRSLSVYVTPYADHVEIRLVFHGPQKAASQGAIQAA